jgi:hypothetical protein
MFENPRCDLCIASKMPRQIDLRRDISQIKNEGEDNMPKEAATQVEENHHAMHENQLTLAAKASWRSQPPYANCWLGLGFYNNRDSQKTGVSPN